MSELFKSLLAKNPDGLNKDAQEMPDDIQMELDFGKLAFAFLKDRAPSLLPYLLGFEIVDREEDGSKAIGIFGHKLGEEFYYVPAFFVNSQIKGMDLLFSKSTNQFMPLKESWINHIVNKQTIRLGDSVDRETVQEEFERPQYDFLVEPPTSAGGIPKTASAVIHDGFEVWNDMQQAMVDMLEKDASFQKAFAGAISRIEKQPLPFDKTADDSLLIDFLEKKGGVEAVNVLMHNLTTNVGFAKAAFSFYPSVDSLFVTEFDASLAPVKEATQITIETEVSEFMDGEHKKKIVRDGFTIVDKRKEEDKSEVFSTEYTRCFDNPDTSGEYDVLLCGGNTAPAYVLLPTGCAKTECLTVVHTDGKQCFVAEPGAVFVKNNVKEEGQPESAYNKAVELSKVKPGSKYVILDEKGCATGPLEIVSTIAEDGKRIKLHVRECYFKKHKRPTYGSDFDVKERGVHIAYEDRFDIRYLQLQDQKGKCRVMDSETLVIPSNFKALEIKEKEDNYSDSPCSDYDSTAFAPGTISDVMESLLKTGVHKLTVGCDDGLEYHMRLDDDFVDGKPCNYKSAAVKLVGQYGLAVSDAEVLLKEARDQYKSRRLVKIAQVGVQMPQPSPAPMGTDPYTQQALEYPQVDLQRGQMIGVPELQDSTQPGFNLGGEAEKDLDAAGLAEQAGQAGQKEVFDHAAIGGLAKLYDTGSIIDSYIPEMMKSLDRLGRIIFLFYWKNDEFSERYGIEDIAEMEDKLRGVFKSYGDLILELKEKAIDADEGIE